MKILLVIPHYFKAEAEGKYGATDGRRKNRREKEVKLCIQQWKHLFSNSTAELVINKKCYCIQDTDYSIDIKIVTANGFSLVEKQYSSRVGIELVERRIDDPRMLPFETHEVMTFFADDYDIIAFAEDDLFCEDKEIFDKINYFVKEFEIEKVLIPNRYEYFIGGPSPFTYIDGPISEPAQSKINSFISGEPYLQHEFLGQNIGFERAKNPHSGFFALTSEQFDRWRNSSTFRDRDSSFVSPLESASGFSVAKQFCLYKSKGKFISYCAIRHMQVKYSNLKIDAYKCDEDRKKF